MKMMNVLYKKRGKRLLLLNILIVLSCYTTSIAQIQYEPIISADNTEEKTIKWIDFLNPDNLLKHSFDFTSSNVGIKADVKNGGDGSTEKTFTKSENFYPTGKIDNDGSKYAGVTIKVWKLDNKLNRDGLLYGIYTIKSWTQSYDRQSWTIGDKCWGRWCREWKTNDIKASLGSGKNSKYKDPYAFIEDIVIGALVGAAIFALIVVATGGVGALAAPGFASAFAATSLIPSGVAASVATEAAATTLLAGFAASTLAGGTAGLFIAASLDPINFASGNMQNGIPVEVEVKLHDADLLAFKFPGLNNEEEITKDYVNDKLLIQYFQDAHYCRNNLDDAVCELLHDIKTPAFYEPQDLFIVPHRGLWGTPANGIPGAGPMENALSAIQAANDDGWKIVESDFAGTSDGELVSMHDYTLFRYTDYFQNNPNADYPGYVKDQTLNDMKQLKLVNRKGDLTTEDVVGFEDVLTYIVDNEMLVSLDFKTRQPWIDANGKCVADCDYITAGKIGETTFNEWTSYLKSEIGRAHV